MIPETEATQPPRRWWTGRVKFLAAMGALFAFGYSQYQPAQQMGMLAKGPLEVYKLERSWELTYDAPESKATRSERLLVGYWDEREDDKRLFSARRLIPRFIPIAEREHLSSVVLQPSKAALTRRFPIFTMSQNVRYDLDPTLGLWIEEYRKGDAAKAMGELPILEDDSVARTFIRRVCSNDSTALGQLADSARSEFTPWSRLAPLKKIIPSDCSAKPELLTVAHVADAGRVRRLGYRIASGADSIFEAVWLVDDNKHRTVTTLQVEPVH